MTDFVDTLERELLAAARRRAGVAPRRSRTPLRTLAVAAALCVPAAATAAGGTLYALRGSVIGASPDTPAEQTPAPGTTRMAAFSVADPARGQPRWTLRVAGSRTGLVCSTVGQLVGGRFGIVGLDARFRELAPEVADSCSVRRDDASSLVGARAFAAKRDADVRTVVSGLAGATLRAVSVQAAGRTRAVDVHDDGTFLTVLRGLPEDLGLRVTLRFADGHVERHAFGVSATVAPDPAGGHAWRVSIGGTSSDRRSCVSFSPARQGVNNPFSPPACGLFGGTVRRPTGAFFAVRRLTPGLGGPPFDPSGGDGWWRNTPPRTAVWGALGHDIASVSARAPGDPPHTTAFFRPNGSFLIMFGPDVPARSVAVTVRYRDGRTLVRHGSYRLLTRRVPRRTP